MEKLVPLTKIILTLATAVWSLTLQTPSALAVLCVVELLILLMARRLFNSLKAIFLLVVFAVMLGLIEYAGGTPVECYVSAFRMLALTIIFIYLLGTVRLQDLTATMVQQLKVPYEYAFMFTAGLRFIPDFLEENRMVTEAQACRGMVVKGSFIQKCRRYMNIVRPLMLRSLERSETMALSLELRGFGGKGRTFVDSVAMHGSDYLVVILTCAATAAVFYARIKYGI
ncbi:energy-coupling factor transporter transmembrane component T [Allisonella histaminiformans]|uniref:energy-coupling factor transporter transmembrane component T n=1 Tax=Allisonella histaminiformans TaxID=209880 RepID=UPI002E798C9C|nr:energy-coupling factor transporter transmembrane component T [Allisonella histaminiformans]